MMAHNCNQEMEVRRIVVSGLQGQKIRETSISRNKPSVVVNSCNTSYTGGRGRRIMVRG
jgi:hypothetical protein